VGGMGIFNRELLWAQQPRMFSIATGGTGAVWYVIGGGIANLINKNLPHLKFTAEATAAALDNGKLLSARKVDFAFFSGDAAYDAYQGSGQFKAKIPLRAIISLYPNLWHIVVLEGSGIKSVNDLRGKRVSLGAAGSTAEVQTVRLLEAHGIDPAKDIKRDRLSVAEASAAMKDRKLDAFQQSGGIPLPAVLDLAATPGIRIDILDLEASLPKLKAKWGPVYYVRTIPKGTYPGIDHDVKTVATGTIIGCLEDMDENVVYQITKLIIEKRGDLVNVHKEARNISLENAVVGSPIPYHPGAIRYYKEKGATIQQ
jgi:hypothetical protein